MNKVRRGFTLIEVSLFLAITAAVFVGIAVGTQNSIFQQRYNDSVQSFAEFLRTVYSQVKNVQNSEGRGNTQKAIYGKLVTFGESKNLSGEENTEGEFFTYNIIGNIKDDGTGNIISQLANLDINVVNAINDETTGNVTGYEFVGFAESYMPRWGSKIQTTADWSGSKYEPFKGTLLIVRHPSSGVIYTRVWLGEVIDVNSMLNEAGSDASVAINKVKNALGAALEEGKFKSEVVDFCVNPNGDNRSTLRRDVRLAKGLRNASGIEVINEDADLVDIDGEEVNIGNRCEP